MWLSSSAFINISTERRLAQISRQWHGTHQYIESRATLFIRLSACFLGQALYAKKRRIIRATVLAVGCGTRPTAPG